MKGSTPEPRAAKDGNLVVFKIRKESLCEECHEELWPGRMIRLENGKALCLACADLDHLEFLPSGDAAITRRATRYSRLHAVVVQWARARKRYERQGILAEPAAIERAEQESLADADYRARQRERAAVKRAELDQQFIAAFAQAIRQQFPMCPPEAEKIIAEHACLKHSGRVGRSAAAKEFSADAIFLAVRAHIRHVHTDYDGLLVRFGDREAARAAVHERVADLLCRWQGSSG